MQRQPATPGPAERFLGTFIGTAVRDGRRRLGLTQRDLSGLADLPQSTIRRLERGLPTAASLERVGRLFDRLETRLEASVRARLVVGDPASAMSSTPACSTTWSTD